MTIIILLLAISIGLYLYAKKYAVVGWQDKDGFHYGRKK